MRRTRLAVLLVLALPIVANAGDRTATPTIAGLPIVKVASGNFTPLYRPARDVRSVRVGAFYMMTRPVTNAEFLAFVMDTPSYQRDRIARIFADAAYLTHWAGPRELGPNARPSQPITRVSWFGARAFCKAKGMRLPTEAEWELVAAASRTRRDGSKDPAQRQAILNWYATPRDTLPDVPFGAANYFGVHDMHGVGWEWVEDFNNAVVVADSRERGETSRDRFCGAAALVAQDATDYAAFMRVAMRNSLEAHYTGAILSFRCAADLTTATEKRP